MSKALTELIRDANRYITPADRHAILDLIEQQAARIAELEAQIAPVAPAVDAQPVAWIDEYALRSLESNATAVCAPIGMRDENQTIPLYASAQSEGLRKDAELLDWLDKNMFHREMNEWDARIHRGETMWVMFAPNGVQGSARNVIDAALSQHTGEKDD